MKGQVPMNERGIYGILSTYFLAVVIVFLVLGLVYINFFVSSHESEVFEGIQPFEKANDVKELVFEGSECFGGAATREILADVNWQQACRDRIFEISEPGVKWFKLEELGIYDCAPSFVEFGDSAKCKQTFVFFFTLIDGSKNCLGKFVFCF